jgi:hypothetical protein
MIETKTVGLLFATGLLTGCALFTSPMEQPVIQDYVGTYFSDRNNNVFSLTADRRTVLYVRRAATKHGILVCAEPPADVAQNIASSVRAMAEASAKDTTGRSVGASAEFSKSLNTSVISLFYRSQGIQLYRDGLFNLCQSYMNGLIESKTEFWTHYDKLIERSFALIAQEIPTAQTLREVELAKQAASTKSAIDATLQKAQQAQAEAEKAALRATEAVKQLPKP